MTKTCTGTLAGDSRVIARFSEPQILEGLDKHADPKWWESHPAKNANQAYLRRWGALLRREARRRELL